MHRFLQLHFLLQLALLIVTLFFLLSCTKSSSDKEETGGSGSPLGLFSSDCGTVVNGSLQNPASSSDAEIAVLSQVAGPNLLVVQKEQGPQLVKLFGLGSDIPVFRRQMAINHLQQYVGQEVYLFQKASSCPLVLDGQAAGVSSQVFSAAGSSINESLINTGAALVDDQSESQCDVSLVTSCYQALLESAVPALPTQDVGRFLWKPVAERDGNLVVLVGAFQADVVVNGQKLVDFGPSNGFGTTARGNKPGCAYGNNVKVEAFNSVTGQPYSIKGETSYTVANGCQRVQF